MEPLQGVRRGVLKRGVVVFVSRENADVDGTGLHEGLLERETLLLGDLAPVRNLLL